jgi:5-formyltetrahydrofolate cyclo-ligase
MESQYISDLKAECRALATAQRAVAYAADPDAGDALARQFRMAIAVSPGLSVSGYWPLPGELDVRPLLIGLRGQGHPIGLPVVVRRHEPLIFRQWRSADSLQSGKFNVMTPPPEAPEIVPDVLLVPMLAFDPDGYRLGYGGGFYDRTLDQLRRRAQREGRLAPLAIGIAYAAQEMPMVPRGPHDQPLDWVVTERSVFEFAARSEN